MGDWRSALRGVAFTKMTGSGNDFVFFDGRVVDASLVTSPEVVRAICNRHNGIGADGVVVLEPEGQVGHGGARIVYFNSDGTPADLCGNATLCSTRLAPALGMAAADGMTLTTPAGAIASRLVEGTPEIDLQPVGEIRTDIAIDLGPGERRIGYVVAGIPHLVVLCDNADAIDLEGRGPGLRRHPATGPAGANVNWVSPRADGRWRYRTFERGVEGETLACGTGAVATAVLLQQWSLATPPTVILTSSGRELTVRRRPDEPAWSPSLRGEGRVVFEGRIGQL